MKVSFWICWQIILIIVLLKFVCMAISCFKPYLSCNSPSQKLCSTSQSQVIIQKPTGIDIQLCLQDGWLLAFCSWKCNAENCTGFNVLEGAMEGEDMCHLYLDYLPELYRFSNNCTFYKLSGNGDSCVPDENVIEMIAIYDYSDVPIPDQNNGWIVIHQRYGKTQEFNKSWSDYRNGFGSPGSNYWFGLEKIYSLIFERSYNLKFEVMTDSGIAITNEYSFFALSEKSKGYAIKVAGYVGYNQDIMDYSPSGGSKHNGQMFSTADEDNDGNSNINCAKAASGGWWYHNQQCATTDLHGSYPASYKIKVSSSDIPVAIKSSRMLIKAK